MSRTPDRIAEEIRLLRPPGFASAREATDYQAALDSATANEFGLIEASMEALLPEADPGQAANLLLDYERVLGADPYGRDLASLPVGQRRQIAVQRWTETPVMCAGYFVRLGASLGVTLTIDEFPLSECGAFECGTEPVTWLVHLQFVVHLPATIEWFGECGVLECGEPGSGSQANFMEAILRWEAPLQTFPVFYYA
jgi:uncharacterized protein YmfQ (DUF2313 family)